MLGQDDDWMKDTREMREIGRVCEKKRSLPMTTGGRSELGGGSTRGLLQQNLNMLRRDTAARQRHGTQGQAGRHCDSRAKIISVRRKTSTGRLLFSSFDTMVQHDGLWEFSFFSFVYFLIGRMSSHGLGRFHFSSLHFLTSFSLVFLLGVCPFLFLHFTSELFLDIRTRSSVRI
ncbi:hypothetical protein B0T26DRAFT_472230 [Lasiosphaeria miniovina]|uniref:Uncharacterized protein n=1 Tax=Lasiosphaeria miniovina TaxID=1954250 RepID=A0AA40DNW5_9PEZI|nr:uncharacterized protein B0T26DRAFT_472230 [Lasiosphaeria miniovina]KAK0706773.1 hypothetical protein B0T26DRAFT_472230 [Lasiosphaeria miniovina]